MGWTEEIYVIREEWPIAFLDYKGITFTKLLGEENLDNFSQWSPFSFKGILFKKLLKKLSQTDQNSRDYYVYKYFKDLEIKETDQIFYKGS